MNVILSTINKAIILLNERPFRSLSNSDFDLIPKNEFNILFNHI